MSQMRVCSAGLAFPGFLGAGASTLCTRTGGLLLRALVWGFALALGAADLRFFAGALLARFALGGADFAGGFVVRFAFGATDARFLAGAFVVRLAFGAVDFRFLAGGFVVLF
jgi:hypothetical protein